MAVDKLVDSTQLDSDLTSVANAIRTKGGTSAQLAFPAGFVSAVEAIPTGGGSTPCEPLDVNFMDYDGTYVHAYEASDFLTLDAMPPLPTHSGLISYEWNWTLEDAKAYVQKYKYLEIGATYRTDDGSSRFYVDIFNDSVRTTGVACQPSVSGGVTIDWGDGTRETVNRTSLGETNHTYASTGEYVIKVKATNGTVRFSGGSYSNIIGGGWGSNNARKLQTLKKIEFGDNVTLGTHLFYGYTSLESVILPYNATSIGNYSFQNTFAFDCLVFPRTFTSLGGTNNFLTVTKKVSFPKGLASNIGVGASQLKRVTMPEGRYCGNTNSTTGVDVIVIPSGITSVATNAYRNARGAKYIEIGEDVTSVGATAFMNAPSSTIRIKATNPPTLANTNAFSWIQNDAVIYVPYSEDHSILEAYKTATNWSTWEARMVEDEP